MKRLVITSLALLFTFGCASEEPFMMVGPPGTLMPVGSDGGAVASLTGEAAVIVPAGALPSELALDVHRVEESLPGDDVLLGPAFDLTPSGTSFDVPVTVSIEIPDDSLGEPVVIVTLDELRGTWEELDTIVIDGRAYAQTTHFSYYGVSLPAGPVSACRTMQANAPPNTVHPLVTPNALSVRGATKTATQPSGFSGPNALELGTTWVASQRFVEVTGNAGIAGEGGMIDWSTRSGSTFTIGAGGAFSVWIDLHTEGPFFGLTDACLAPTANERQGWLYSLNIHCDQNCVDDPATAPPTGMMGCGPTDLCMRSINQCGAALTQTGCEAWYMNPANCRDMPAYTTCNCACITEPTCTDYFDCGQTCFNTHCI